MISLRSPSQNRQARTLRRACHFLWGRRDEKGRFVLTAENVSYALPEKPLKLTAMGRALASCKYVEGHEDDDGFHDGHAGGMNVLFTDGSVRFVLKHELPEDTMLPMGLAR